MSRETCKTLRTGARLLIAAVVIGGLLLPPRHTSAQDGKRGESLSWADAPYVPRYRSQADWLVDAGWKTVAEVYGPFPTRVYEVGDAEQFIPLGGAEGIPATFYLRERTPHAYFWFERGVQVDPAQLEATVRFFEEHIWPLNNSIYGNEWNPGIDGDSRIHIVGQSAIGPGVYGAFNPADQCPRALCPESNQREIIYISLGQAPLGSTEFLTTLAHEHQHLIQYHVDGNERRWFNEGLSQLAEHLNGFAPRYVGSGNLDQFLANPDHRLDGWDFGPQVGGYYGAAYLFMVYLYERFGLEFIRDLAANDYDGLASLERTLADHGYAAGVDGVFADWIVANALDDPYAGDGRYYYQTLDLPTPVRATGLDLTAGGAQVADTVNQYGADYYTLDQPGRYVLSFDGSDRTGMLEIAPQSGAWMWWSYNGVSSAARLTAAFDLTGLQRATLAFSAWWQVEDDYDWFQVLVSETDGATWEIVHGPRAALHGSYAPGAHYSGDSQGWVAERIDLSAYVGQPVLVRFEYLTDSLDSQQGVALDDLGIVELGALDDVESAVSLWEPEGFMRVPETVAQRWSLTVITRAPETAPRVTAVSLDALNTGRATLVVPEGGSATIVVGAMSPFTPYPGRYKLALGYAE